MNVGDLENHVVSEAHSPSWSPFQSGNFESHILQSNSFILVQKHRQPSQNQSQNHHENPLEK